VSDDATSGATEEQVMIEVTTKAEIADGLVVGHDGSRASAQAVRWAARLAGRLACPLHVVRAWTISSAPRPADAGVGYVPSMLEFEQAVRDRLDRDVDRLGLGEVEVTTHVLHGAAARRLLEAAARADMLVVGARGEGGFHGLRFGSTADQVTRHASCPVVVVPVAAADTPADPDSHQAVPAADA
jgi:nucleotide-binding universal stress UspA family protein